jgi:hypothetical protein
MMRWVCAGLAGLALALTAAGGAEGPAPAGTWKLLLSTGEGRMQPVALLRLQNAGGKWAAKVLARADGLPSLDIKDVTVGDGTLRGTVELGGASLRLECPLNADKDGRVRGNMARRDDVTPVELERTTLTSLDELDLAWETLARQADGYDVVRAAVTLLNHAADRKAKPEEVRRWAARAVKAAQAYGPALHRKVVLGTAEILSEQKGYEAIGLTYARQADRMLNPRDRAVVRKHVLDVLATALDRAGKAGEAREVAERVRKLDFTIHPEPYAGRKGKGNRVVLVELFTGAQCPPCVAADLAFDALDKTFKPAEVVRLQYHLHVPGPDPLTSPDAEARAKFYERAIPGTPTLLVNGHPAAPGGGSTEDGPEKYEEYLAAITPLLAMPAKAEVRTRARRSGSKIDIQLEADATAGAGDALRLRCVPVEEQVDYTGTNKLSAHHHVVRAFPGGVEGTRLAAGKSLRQTLTVDLDELRKGLREYLDKVAQESPFPGKERPLELKNLRVVAFVQNDATGEVLQAVQAELAE